MMGRKNPRWGIFANEWQRADKAEQLRDRPNRSVEVLQLKANGRRYIDPIAALSEAPRLPLPSTAQYGVASDEAEAYTVERYDATPALNAVFPGGNNTFGKKSKSKRDRNQGKTDMYGKTAADPDMIREVLNALMSTEEWQTISNAAAAIGEEQPINSGQNVMGDPGMDDPMAGGMPEPPMDEGMGMEPPMAGGMPEPPWKKKHTSRRMLRTDLPVTEICPLRHCWQPQAELHCRQGQRQRAKKLVAWPSINSRTGAEKAARHRRKARESWRESLPVPPRQTRRHHPRRSVLSQAITGTPLKTLRTT